MKTFPSLEAGVADVNRKLYGIVSPDAKKRIGRRAGAAGKASALKAVTADLGSDRAFSGWRRPVKLGAGYDIEGTNVRINFRPVGLWRLAERGRRTSGDIFPRVNNRRMRRVTRGRAVMTPEGPRARSSWGPTRGHRTFTSANRLARQSIPQAAAAAIRTEVAREFRRGMGAI